MTPKLKNKVAINIMECHGQGISASVVLDGFKKMKAELEALDCEVHMTIDSLPIEVFLALASPVELSEAVNRIGLVPKDGERPPGKFIKASKTVK